MKNYRIYRLKRREKCVCVVLTLGMSSVISWLFYRSFYAMVAILPLFVLVKRLVKKYLHKKQRREMVFQFREMLQFISGALKAGYSMENAFLQGWREYIELYGEKTIMAQEFCNMIHQMKLNTPLEQLMESLAQRSGIEEIESFTQVFAFAKRGGGDMMKIFQGTAEKIRQKADVEREIETVLAAKKTEQRIMDLVPFGILLYVGLTSSELLAPLYGNPAGVFVMTLCLLGYAGAFLLAEKILDIRI